MWGRTLFLFSVLLIAGSGAVGQSASGPVAAYGFNENGGTSAADASGNGNTAALFGGTSWAPGHTGGGLNFDGTSGYSTAPTLPYIANWTVSVWVRSPAAPADSNYSGPLHRQTNFQINWNHLNANFRGAAAVKVADAWFPASFGPLAANTWYYLAATYDGETLNAYTNGVLVTSNSTPSGPAPSDPNPLTFGKHAAINDYFQGTIDDVRIYSRALSQAEIQTDMNIPVGGSSDTTPPTVTITTPTGTSTYTTSTSPITLGGTASDNVGVTQVTWSHDRGGSGTATGTSNWTASGITLQAGTNVLTVTARDAASNTRTATLTVTYTPITSGPVAAYGFNENGGTSAADASGNGNIASLFGGTSWSQGHTGSGLSFDGASGYSTAPTLPYMANWTVSVWVRSPAAPSDSNYSGPLHRQTNFQINWNHVNANFRGAAAVKVADTWFPASFGPLVANTWYHLAATYDGETLNAYTNGVLVTSNSAPSGPAASDPNPLTFGKHAAINDYFQGTIDDVRIYNLALGQAEIQTDMNITVGGSSSDTTSPTVTITTPTIASTYTTSTSPITLGGTASDNVGVTQVTWSNDRGGSGAATGTTGWTASGITLQVGTNVLNVTAQDAASNTRTATLTVTYTPITSGPVAAHGFNENGGTSAADASGNGNTAGLFGGTSWVPGHTGSGLNFDGTSGYSTAPTLPFISNWTVSVWVRSPAAPSDSNYSGPLHRETNFQINWNHVNANFRGAAAVNVGGTWYSASFGPLAANTWYYLAATYDGENLNAYTNGVLITSNSAPSGPPASDPNPLTFGKHAAINHYFQGTIDDVRIYSRALSQAEIQTDMNIPVGGSSDTTPPAVTITTPTGTSTYTTSTSPITLGGTASDNVGVTQVTWSNDRGGSGTATGTTSWTASGITLQAGTNVLTITARDAANNTRTATLSVTYPSTTLTSFATDHLYLGRFGPPVAVSADAVVAGRKPSGIPTLNTNHPLAANLTAFWLMNEGQGSLIRNVVNPGVYDVQIQNLTFQHWATLPGSGDVGIFCENLSNTSYGVLTSTLTTTTTFTWHARVNLSSLTGNYGLLFGTNGDTGMYIRPYLSDAKLQYYWTFYNDTSWGTGQWVDLVAVLNNSQLTYYLNGVPNGGPYGQGTMNVTNMFNDVLGERIHGYVEFERIWVGRALTAAEVADAVADPYGVFQ